MVLKDPSVIMEHRVTMNIGCVPGEGKDIGWKTGGCMELWLEE